MMVQWMMLIVILIVILMLASVGATVSMDVLMKNMREWRATKSRLLMKLADETVRTLVKMLVRNFAPQKKMNDKIRTT